MKPTLHEKILTRLQNHRLAVVLILIGTLVIALSGFTDAAKNLAGLFSKPSPEDARIKLASMSVPYTPKEFVEKAAEGDLTAVNLFLAAGMDPNIILEVMGDPTALFLAARENRLEVVKALLKSGAKVINQGSNALAGAAQSGNPAIVNLLLKSPVERDKVDEAFIAAGNRQIFEILLAHGADIKKSGARALLYASDPESVAFLVSRGADINAKDPNGRTLMEQMDFDTLNLNTLRILIDRGANLETRDKKGWTLLNNFASRWIKEGVEMLLAKGVDINAPNPKGRTALSLACDSQYRNGAETVRLLLKSGAEVNARDRDGKTALDYARQRPHAEIVQLLLDHGAK